MARSKSSLSSDEMSGLSNVEFDPSEDEEVLPTFESMGLREELLRRISSCGLEQPSVIQQRGIIPIVSGRDVIAHTPSGADKTATFAISLLQSLDTTLRETQVLVLTPTCESATNIQRVVRALGDYMDVQCHACIGGTRRGEDKRKMDYGQHVVTGTPGRVFDMIRRNILRTTFVKLLIFDDTDQMLNKGFKKHIYDIYRCHSLLTQVVLHYTIENSELNEMSEKMMYNALKICIKRDDSVLEGIQKISVAVDGEEGKFDTLCDLYDTLTTHQALIFCNTEGKVEWLTQKMLEANFTVSSMHGDMTQKKRSNIMKEFRSGKSRVLISTRDWARDIEVRHPPVVINFDAPINRESTTPIMRRICRPSRCGRSGVVVSFVVSNRITE